MSKTVISQLGQATVGGIEKLHAASRRKEQPKNIIWMVTDGMSPGVLPMAEQFSLCGRGKGTIWHAGSEAGGGACPHGYGITRVNGYGLIIRLLFVGVRVTNP